LENVKNSVVPAWNAYFFEVELWKKKSGVVPAWSQRGPHTAKKSTNVLLNQTIAQYIVDINLVYTQYTKQTKVEPASP
jgi:hypothetical protein